MIIMAAMVKKIPLNPKHPERICWGCNKYCSASDLRCGNGSERTPHPAEIFGEDWAEWTLDAPDLPEEQDRGKTPRSDQAEE